jgi:hypothetical protein
MVKGKEKGVVGFWVALRYFTASKDTRKGKKK